MFVNVSGQAKAKYSTTKSTRNSFGSDSTSTDLAETYDIRAITAVDTAKTRARLGELC